MASTDDDEVALEYDPVFLDSDNDGSDDGDVTNLAGLKSAGESEHRIQALAGQPAFDIDLVVVDASNAALRFNGEGTYIARSSGVEVRCTLADQVHGELSAENDTPCSLLVFDFDFDRRRIATVHEVVIDLILHGKVKVHRPHGVAPDRTISFNPQEVNRGRTNGNNFSLGVDYMVKAETGKTNEEKEDTKVTEYAHALGWTRHWPRNRYNDPSPHNCVSWSVQENVALKDGLPRHFRGAVLLEREKGVTQFELDMRINSTADFLSTVLNTLRGSIPAGRLKIDATSPPTNNLRIYGPASPGRPVLLGNVDVQAFAELSQGSLQERIFD